MYHIVFNFCNFAQTAVNIEQYGSKIKSTGELGKTSIIIGEVKFCYLKPWEVSKKTYRDRFRSTSQEAVCFTRHLPLSLL